MVILGVQELGKGEVREPSGQEGSLYPLFIPIKCSHSCHLYQGGFSFLLPKQAQMLGLIGTWLAGLVRSGENLVLFQV